MKLGCDNMFWEEFIHQSALFFGTIFGFSVDDSSAGMLVSFIFISSIMLAVYVLTRGTVSNSKTWIAVSYIISCVILIYPIGWLASWWGVGTLAIPVSIYIADKASSLAKTGGH